MIEHVWFRLIMLPAIVVAAFALFCVALVVALIGIVDPHSTAERELSKLARGAGVVYRAITRPIV